MKFLVAVVLLAFASTASAGSLYGYKPAPAPACTKGCKASYQVCTPVVTEEQQCTQPKPVYVKPVYTPAKPMYGRKLSGNSYTYKPVYVAPAPTPSPAPVCQTVKVTKNVCTDAPCTTTTTQPKTTCTLVCSSPAPAPAPMKPVYVKPAYTPVYGRKLSGNTYDYKPVYVAPTPVVKPVCQNQCTTVQVQVQTCLSQCVYDICPSPKLAPVVKPVYKPVYKPSIDLSAIKGKVESLLKKGN